MNQELITLAQKVKEMRETQNLYFKYRGSYNLDKSKKLEAEVDALVKSILNPPLNQQELFG